MTKTANDIAIILHGLHENYNKPKWLIIDDEKKQSTSDLKKECFNK